MNFGFTEEQDLLRAEVRKFLGAHCPLAEVRRLTEGSEGWARPLWKQVAELGWTGLTIPEAHGGAGLGFEDLVVVLEETGRSLFPSPLVSTTLAAAALLEAGSAAQQAQWLPRLADGSVIGSLAVLEASDRLGPEGVALRGKPDRAGFVLDGEKLFVCDAGAADLFVLVFRSGDAPGDLSLAALPRGRAGLAAEDVPGIDLTRRVGRLRLSQVRVEEGDLLGAPGHAAPALARVLDLGACAVAAEAAGAAEAALALTVGYAKQRTQFGSPIGRWQGVKHPLAEMLVEVESLKSLVYYAAWALDRRAPDAPVAVSRAKALASEAFARIGIDAVQLHGAIGYTWQYDAQLYLKRSKWVRPAFGDASHHWERVFARGGA
jgi:alkylation response protein AidB-like acyl-CoA dehydrogenase